MKKSRALIVSIGVACLATAAQAQVVGAVYTQSNSSTGNEVLSFDRTPAGLLDFTDSVPTTGVGNGGSLGSQGAVELSYDGLWLFVVNAGSHAISVFSVGASGLTLTDVEPSLGMTPISVVHRENRVYVVNKDSANVAGFTLASNGTLSPIAGSIRPLSAPTADPAQIDVGPGGAQVFVTEKATNKIAIYPIGAGGSLGAATFVNSAGATPFGFSFGVHDTLIVSEAFMGATDASAVSSYKIGLGALTTVSSSVPTTETAACWIAVTRGGRYAYTTNTGSGTVTGYHIAKPSGVLTPLDADGVTANLGPNANPLDAALTLDSRWLYVLSPMTSEIATFRVHHDGSLETFPSTFGLPASTAGLAAR